jgi:CPA1 family monovalent cation:H+ antiporter
VHTALEIVGLVVVVGFVAAAADRVGASPPLVLVVAGIGISYIPGTPQFTLNPDVVLVGLLPPLLYSAAIQTSLVEFKANRQAIALLSVGLVAFSTATVGLVAWWTIPMIGLSAGLALGAVVAPPDAVAASAVARRVGMPRRIVTLLESESLVNDATALVALNTAIAAIKTSTVQAGSVALDLLLAAGGGLAVGIVAATVLSMIRKRINDPVLDTTLSFTAPYVAFLPAQAIHSSGVLAVVVTGLILGHRAPALQSAASRVAERTNWATVAFLLENVVFLLIGLQLRTLLDGVHDSGLSPLQIIWSCTAVLLTVILSRIFWVYATNGIYRGVVPKGRRRQAWTWPTSTVIAWAGMRGVVTLAAVFLLPDEPQLNLLRLAAFTVVAGTLLIQGLSLPWLVRRLRLPSPDAAEDALQSAGLVSQASRAGLERLEEVRSPDDPEDVIDQLRERAERRSNAVWEELGRSQAEIEPPAATYRRLRMQMLNAERESILKARDKGVYDDYVLRSALASIDIEESMLDRVVDAQSQTADDLVAPVLSNDCEHLRDAPRTAVPGTPGACEECLRDGTRWVHLRMCLTCGHVGCCDSSVGLHANGHFVSTGHPVMRSVEPGEAWRWCYVDEQLG